MIAGLIYNIQENNFFLKHERVCRNTCLYHIEKPQEQDWDSF